MTLKHKVDFSLRRIPMTTWASLLFKSTSSSSNREHYSSLRFARNSSFCSNRTVSIVFISMYINCAILEFLSVKTALRSLSIPYKKKHMNKIYFIHVFYRFFLFIYLNNRKSTCSFLRNIFYSSINFINRARFSTSKNSIL